MDGKDDERLEDGGTKLAELRRRLELEKTEVLKKMSNQKKQKKHQKDKKNSVRLPSSLSASSNRTAHNEVYTCGATPTRRNLETISTVIGSEERVCTATFLRNTTPSQPVMNLESGSKRKYLHTFPVGNIESDSPRKRFKRILNFWDTTTQPEPNPVKPRVDN